MSAPQGGSFVCECGKIYKTNSNLMSHKRRFCRLHRAGPSTSTSASTSASTSKTHEGVCPVCNIEFATYMGMRQHMRLRHPAEYNSSLQQESKGARKAWTEDEENTLARTEAEFVGENLLDHLVSISNRTKEAIRKRRLQPTYVEKVRRFKEENERRQQEMAERIQLSHAPEEERRSSVSENMSNLRRDAELIEIISSLPRHKLDGDDIEFLRKVTSSEKSEVEVLFDQWSEFLVQKYQKKKSNGGQHKETTTTDVMMSKLKNGKLSNRRRRALEYKLAQYQFKNNRTAYSRLLLDDKDSNVEDVTPNSKDIENTYIDIFGTESKIDDDDITNSLENRTDVSYPITAEEIEEALKNSRSNTPGPDGVSLEDARKIPIDILLLFFNTILYLEYIPRIFKKSRTVLIPKSVKDLHLVKNWRPITVSNILMRLFNKILVKRLNTIELCNKQRGFTRIDGCFANYATIETLLSHFRKHAKPISIISLDVTKAFDLVSHHSIQRALRRLQIDEKTRSVIAANYINAETTLTCSKQIICSCPVKRGVKQGDPMSPFLFNAVMDELLVQLSNLFSGVQIGEEKVSCLAYADDLVLIANTPEDAQRMLDHCIKFLAGRGLEVNAAKCHSVVMQTVPGKKKNYVATEPSFQVLGEPIPPISIGDEFRYLGQMFNSGGLTECTQEKLSQQLTAIRRAPLKPQQKYIIVRDHLIPRYVAVLQRPRVSTKVLQKTDRLIRSTLKTILHLPRTCSSAIFYAPLRCGGLGIFQFSKMIPIVTLARWENLSGKNELLRETFKMSEPWVQRYRQMIAPQANTKEAVHKQQEEELHGSYSGGGINQVKFHPACNSYLRRPPRYWNGEDFVRAVLLRFNLLPSKGIPSNPPTERRCRAGCFKTESLSHILQQCPLTHWWRIQRHDHVVKRLADFAKKEGWSVTVEPHVRCMDGSLKKPDLIFEKDNSVIVTDVGVHWEGEIPLSTFYEHKVSTYSTEAFTTKLQQIYVNKNIYVLPMIVGARGGWCGSNNFLSEKIKLSSSNISDITTTTIRGSCLIHKQFMKNVWSS